MPDYPKLAKPPIIEALVDIQVQPAAGVSVELLKRKLSPSVRAQYPKSEELKKFEGRITHGPTGANVSGKDLGAYGVMLRNQASTRAVQMRVDGLAVSHLQQYSNFESLEAEAQTLWAEYVKMAGPIERIFRVALRYINVIECNRTLTSWEEFAEFLKHVPPPIKGVTSVPIGFGLEVVGHDAKNETVTTVRCGLLKNLQTQQHGISVDIEVVKHFSDSPDAKTLWSSIQALRPIKNDVFFDMVAETKIKEYR